MVDTVGATVQTLIDSASVVTRTSTAGIRLLHNLAPLRKKCVGIIEVRGNLAKVGAGSAASHVVGDCLESAVGVISMAACAVEVLGAHGGGRCHAVGIAASHACSTRETSGVHNVLVGRVSKGLHSIVQEAHGIGGCKEEDS